MAVDFNRRKKVMARSIKLGHCICNPKKPCPCDTFETLNICTCAGERPPKKQTAVALTRHVRKAGCASKIGQADLMRILGHLPPVTDPAVLVGTSAGDDAGVYLLDENTALVQTVDVFTPCVDDPHLFGRIAAANSVSDVYAMGGRPLTALSIVGFPIDELDGAVMEEILLGGIETLDDAGCVLIGGHSINDEEIKCGFAVTGTIDPGAVLKRDTPCDGDALVLTKPLGTGIICFAAQIGRIDSRVLAEAGESMATLNRDAAELMPAYDAHACTDVTGYGLMGHLAEMVRRSGLSAEIDLSLIPVFASIPECIQNDIVPGAVERNMEYAMAWADLPDNTNGSEMILYDPQTSGGLLVSLPGDRAEAYVEELRSRGHHAAVIGRIVDGGETGHVSIRGTELNNLIGTPRGIHEADKIHGPGSPPDNARERVTVSADSEPCCESPPFDDDVPDSDAESGANMKHVNAPGRVDGHAKKLMEIALSVAQRCRPCLEHHIDTALQQGITREEIEEAAQLAISFSGCPSLMMYREVCKERGL